MIMKRYSILLAVTAIFWAACTKDIEYKGPDSKRMLIVNSITQSGDTMVLKISHSAFFLDSYYSGNYLKSGVNVSIDINGQTRDAVYSDSVNGYTDLRAIKDGDIISVTASHPSYGTITATDTVPYAQNCVFSDYRKEYVHNQNIGGLFEDYDYYYAFEKSVDSVWVTEIEIQGINDRKDYYMMTIEPSMTYFRYNEADDKYDTLTQNLHFKIPSETRILLGQTDATSTILDETESDNDFEWGYTDFIFDDLHIKDGNRFSFDIMMEMPDTMDYIYVYNEEGYYMDAQPYSIADKIKDDVIYSVNVRLYVLSGTYYYYHKSVKDYLNADDISFLSEPVTILHNIKGGAGVLATYTGKTFHKEFRHKFK